MKIVVMRGECSDLFGGQILKHLQYFLKLTHRSYIAITIGLIWQKVQQIVKSPGPLVLLCHCSVFTSLFVFI